MRDFTLCVKSQVPKTGCGNSCAENQQNEKTEIPKSNSEIPTSQNRGKSHVPKTGCGNRCAEKQQNKKTGVPKSNSKIPTCENRTPEARKPDFPTPDPHFTLHLCIPQLTSHYTSFTTFFPISKPPDPLSPRHQNPFLTRTLLKANLPHPPSPFVNHPLDARPPPFLKHPPQLFQFPTPSPTTFSPKN